MQTSNEDAGGIAPVPAYYNDKNGRELQATSERYFTLRQVAEVRLGSAKLYHTVRRWFQNEPGVINAGSGKRNRFILVPESVAERVIRKRMNGGRS